MPREKDTIGNEFGYFMIFDIIFDEKMFSSPYVFTVYAYLCRCANKQGRCYPGYENIMKHCGVARSTLAAALKELMERELIKIEKRVSSQGRSSNHYTVLLPMKKEIPSFSDDSKQLETALNQLLETYGTDKMVAFLEQKLKNADNASNIAKDNDLVSSADERTPVRQTNEPQFGKRTNPSSADEREGRYILRATHIKGESEGAVPPENPPAQNKKSPPSAEEQKKEHGHYRNVMLTKLEYDVLIRDHGESKIADYIERVGFQIASGKVHYPNHEVIIRKWIHQDSSKNKNDFKAEENKTVRRRNRFSNFKGRVYDFEDIERKEFNYLLSTLGEDFSENMANADEIITKENGH